MYPVIKWLASGWTLLLLNASPTPVLADNAGLNLTRLNLTRLNLLVVAETTSPSKFQPGLIEHSVRIVMTKLTEHGHTVFETPATNIAKPPPLDVVITVSANVSLKTGVYVSHLEVRTRARLRDGRTGRHIDMITLAPYRSRRLPSQCRRSCLRAVAARLVDARSGHLGTEIARRLANISPPPPRKISPPITPTIFRPPPSPSWELTFRGIPARDMAEIESYLVVFPGYGGHRRIKHGAAWRYETSLDQAGLERALAKMLRLMGIGARITREGRSMVIHGAGLKPAANTSSKDW